MDIAENVNVAKIQLKKIDIIFTKKMQEKEIFCLIYLRKSFMKFLASLVIIAEN